MLEQITTQPIECVSNTISSSRNSSSSSNLSTSSSSYCSCNSSGDDERTLAPASLEIPVSASSANNTPTSQSTHNKMSGMFAQMSLASDNQPSTRTSNNSTATLIPSASSTITSIRSHPLYIFQDKIRSGGFGDVYKGTRRGDNTPIAIKVIRKDKITSWHQVVSHFAIISFIKF
jgi:hypothetical protein